MRALILIAGLVVGAVSLSAQEARLAQQYYQNGEYEKAGLLYEKLYDESKNDFYFTRYIECLLSLEQFDEAEKIVEKEIKRRPQDLQLYVTYGSILERQYKDEEAEKQYRDAIKNLNADQFSIVKLANAFMGLTKYDLAIEAYEKGAKLLKDEKIFAYNLGNLYQQKGETPKMIEYYLLSLEDNPGRLNSLQAVFQRYLQESDYDELQMQLYTRLQERQDAVEYIELLTWVFIQKEDYANALRQAKAIDKRLNENGGRIYSLAEIAANDKDYDAAIAAYDYIVEEKGFASPYYIDAKRQSLRCSRNKLVAGYNYTLQELKQLESQYDTFLNEFGRNNTTAAIVMELADLQALYINDLDKAIELLNEMIKYPHLNANIEAEGKIKLADYYLMKGEIWEATLLYSQVDKVFADDLIGHEARYKNAKLSYYTGNFQWAQAQFDVLKASTSKLIANDALDLSVFILDNMGLDTTAVPLEMYASADMLVFQNKFDSALAKMDSLMKQYPQHSLDDDVLYLKAKIYSKRKEYPKAVEMYQSLIEKYPDEIRADNSLFELAALYENQLNEPDKAKELYEKIFIDYSNSTFAVEARKRFRILRGDKIQ